MSNDQRTVNIEIGDKEWEGIYSNFVIITHSNSEFVLDFARMLPGANKAKVFARILMTPQHARALQQTLGGEYQEVRKRARRDQARTQRPLARPHRFPAATTVPRRRLSDRSEPGTGAVAGMGRRGLPSFVRPEI